MSVLEMSHRSKTIIDMMEQAEADIRTLADLPSDYALLFLQGGASLQFSMVPMNLLSPDGQADHIVSGHFARIALQEAQKIGRVNVAGTTEAQGFTRVPYQEELELDPSAAYVHFTANNTIYGTEWKSEPEVGKVPLVADISSNAFSKPLDVSKYGLIYAGAQKNLGIAGLTLVIIREDLLSRSPDALPAMLSYKTQQKSGSAFNTPPVFGIYILGLVIKWILQQGGLPEMARRNQEKAQLLYDLLDSSEFYRGHALPGDRSPMNVTFRLPDEELEQRFVDQAATAGTDGIEGTSLGGRHPRVNLQRFP